MITNSVIEESVGELEMQLLKNFIFQKLAENIN